MGCFVLFSPYSSYGRTHILDKMYPLYILLFNVFFNATYYIPIFED